MKNVSRTVRTVHGSFYDDDVIYEDRRYNRHLVVLLWWNETNMKRRGFTFLEQVEAVFHRYKRPMR